MSKAEKFIKAKTRIGSNTTKGWRRNGVSIPSYSLPWLTPDEARRAVEIAREETIKDVCEWIEKNVDEKYIHFTLDNCADPEIEWYRIIDDLKKHFEPHDL